jgi:hypothetical protein
MAAQIPSKLATSIVTMLPNGDVVCKAILRKNGIAPSVRFLQLGHWGGVC